MSKRPKGSITQLENGTYQVRASYGKRPDGKRNTLFKITTTKKRAEYELKRFLAEAEKASKKNNNYDVLSMTVQEYFDQVYLPYKHRTLKPQSYDRLVSSIKNHIYPKHGSIILSKVTSNDINILISDLYLSGKSYSSVKKVYDAYNSMFNYLVHKSHDMDSLDNPMDGVEMLSPNKFDNKRIKWYNPDEILKIKEECLKQSVFTHRSLYRYGLMFMLIMYTGIREGEACALKKSDIDFVSKTINVNKNVYVEKVPGGYNVQIGTVKYANSERVVSVSDTALTYVKQIMDQFPETDMLIYADDYKLVRPATLSRSFSKVLNNSGVCEGSLHSLRHTYVSMLFDAGINLYVIAAQIGDDPGTVKRTYLHLYKKRKAQNLVGIDVVARAEEMIAEGIIE